MRRPSLITLALLLILNVLGGWALSSATAQVIALRDRGPRFLREAPSGGRVEVNATSSPTLRRVVSLSFDSATVGTVLGAIERQTGLEFLYSRAILPVDRPVTLRAERITVAAALMEILVDAGVDVLLTSGRQILFVRHAAPRDEQPTGTVTGVVTDSKTGQGIGGVDVSLEGTRSRGTTGQDGRYRLADVSPGSFTVLARRIGYGPERRAVTVTAGQEATVNVALEPAATKLGDVVVTAQKREERLQDVPLSIAVVTPEEIDRRGLVSAEDYLRGIAGVNQVDAGALGGQAIVIRGIETAPAYQNMWTGTTVATYFGETPTTNSAGLAGGSNVDLKLVDIERVEVLRGPQGTAFGNSSMGGAVRTIPVAPKLDRVEGKLAASYSATSRTGGDNYNFHAVGNVPLLKDKLALRATGYRYEESGFYRNRAGSDAAFQAAVVTPFGAEAFATDAEEVGAATFTGGRLAALFQASDALRVTLGYLRQKTETDDLPRETRGPYERGTYEQVQLGVAPEHVIRGQQGGLFDTDIDIANAMLEYNLGWANLLATYSHTKSGSIASYPYGSFGLNWPVSETANSEHREHSGEIRLVTQLDGAWNFLAGLYAEELNDEVAFHPFWHGDPETNFFGADRDLDVYDDRRKLTQKAAFGEASWELLQGFTLTGGVRAYEYDRTFRIESRGPYWGVLQRDVATKASGATFRGNLSYKPNDGALLYAGWSEGFRLGRLQPGLAPGVCDRNGDGIVDGSSNITIESTRRLEPDKVDSYELGGKFTLLDRRLTIAADVFRMDWSDMPVTLGFGTLGSTDGSGCGLGFLTNAGAARSEGVEFQANLRITDAFGVDVGGSWIHARLTEDAPGDRAGAGNRLPGSPELNANLGVQYEFAIAGQRPLVRADAIYVGPFYGDMRELPINKAGKYVKLDASARVAIRDINIDLFVRNLTNEDAFTFAGYRLRPRTIGLQLSRSF